MGVVGLSVAVVLGCGRGLSGGKSGPWGRERGGGAEEGGLRRRDGGMLRVPGGGGLRVRFWGWMERGGRQEDVQLDLFILTPPESGRWLCPSPKKQPKPASRSISFHRITLCVSWCIKRSWFQSES